MNIQTKNSSSKANYFRLIEKSIVISLLVVIVSFQSFKKFERNTTQVINPVQTFIVEEVPVTKIHERPPAPTKPKIPLPVDDPAIPDDLTITETELFFDEEYPNPPKPTVIVEQSFDEFDADPEPIGGMAAIKRHLMYPEYARRAGIQGKVVIKALIDEEGKVIEWEFLESSGFGGCDQAALYAMKKTKWKPAIRKLKPVRDWVTIPFRFRLVNRY